MCTKLPSVCFPYEALYLLGWFFAHCQDLWTIYLLSFCSRAGTCMISLGVTSKSHANCLGHLNPYNSWHFYHGWVSVNCYVRADFSFFRAIFLTEGATEIFLNCRCTCASGFLPCFSCKEAVKGIRCAFASLVHHGDGSPTFKNVFLLLFEHPLPVSTSI